MIGRIRNKLGGSNRKDKQKQQQQQEEPKEHPQQDEQQQQQQQTTRAVKGRSFFGGSRKKSALKKNQGKQEADKKGSITDIPASTSDAPPAFDESHIVNCSSSSSHLYIDDSRSYTSNSLYVDDPDEDGGVSAEGHKREQQEVGDGHHQQSPSPKSTSTSTSTSAESDSDPSQNEKSQNIHRRTTGDEHFQQAQPKEEQQHADEGGAAGGAASTIRRSPAADDKDDDDGKDAEDDDAVGRSNNYNNNSPSITTSSSTKTPQSLEDLYLNPYDPNLLAPSRRDHSDIRSEEDEQLNSQSGEPSTPYGRTYHQSFFSRSDSDCDVSDGTGIRSVSTNASTVVTSSCYSNTASSGSGTVGLGPAGNNIKLLDFEKDILSSKSGTSSTIAQSQSTTSKTPYQSIVKSKQMRESVSNQSPTSVMDVMDLTSIAGTMTTMTTTTTTDTPSSTNDVGNDANPTSLSTSTGSQNESPCSREQTAAIANDKSKEAEDKKKTDDVASLSASNDDEKKCEVQTGSPAQKITTSPSRNRNPAPLSEDKSTKKSGPLSPARASMERLRALEEKRHALRHQRFSLEQRLYEFRGRQLLEKKTEALAAKQHVLNAEAKTPQLQQVSRSVETESSTTPARRTLFADDDGLAPSSTETKSEEGLVAIQQTTPKMVVDWKYKTVHGVEVSFTGPLMLDEDGRPHPDSNHAVLEATLHFVDGQMYKGCVEHGLRHGLGQNMWPDGQKYKGEWSENSREGRGTHSWRDGRSVTGEWKNGHLNGKIYFTWPNGSTFDGQAKMGKKCGRGVHKFADGKVYSGHYENGKESGFGTLTLPDGVKYRGTFCRGVKEGYGVMLWKTRTYDGEWVDNKPHGQGRVVWSNGAIYTGQFEAGKYHGLGVYVWPSGKKFVGRWEAGIKNGHGLYTWPNGKKYDGEYVDGLKEGYGRMTWTDGSMYCGGFKKNKRHGRGVQTDPEGAVVHCGLWKDDSPVDEHSSVPQVADSSGMTSSNIVRGGEALDDPNESLNTSAESEESSLLPPPQNTSSNSEDHSLRLTYPQS